MTMQAIHHFMSNFFKLLILSFNHKLKKSNKSFFSFFPSFLSPHVHLLLRIFSFISSTFLATFTHFQPPLIRFRPMDHLFSSSLLRQNLHPQEKLSFSAGRSRLFHFSLLTANSKLHHLHLQVSFLHAWCFEPLPCLSV